MFVIEEEDYILDVFDEGLPLMREALKQEGLPDVSELAIANTRDFLADVADYFLVSYIGAMPDGGITVEVDLSSEEEELKLAYEFCNDGTILYELWENWKLVKQGKCNA
jgi:hypothetical protein